MGANEEEENVNRKEDLNPIYLLFNFSISFFFSPFFPPLASTQKVVFWNKMDQIKYYTRVINIKWFNQKWTAEYDNSNNFSNDDDNNNYLFEPKSNLFGCDPRTQLLTLQCPSASSCEDLSCPIWRFICGIQE